MSNEESLQEYNTRLAENNTSLDNILTTINNLPDGGGSSGMSDVYSTEETVIGTWINGEPLYRKVIVTDTVNLSAGSHKLANLDASCLVKSLRCLLYGPTGQFVLGSDTSEINHKNNNIIVKTTIDWGSGYVEIVVEYTKTTD